MWNGSGWYGFIAAISTSTTDISRSIYQWGKTFVTCFLTSTQILKSDYAPGYNVLRPDPAGLSVACLTSDPGVTSLIPALSD